MIFGRNRKGASYGTSVHCAVFSFGMSTFRPYILHIIFGVLQRKRPFRSVHPLRFEDPTQLDLQTEKHMEQGRREEERGRHRVFSY